MKKKTLRYPRFLEDDLPEVSAQDARFHLIPCPLDRSTSYGKGADRGPSALLCASRQLEAFDGRGVPGEAGIFVQPPVDCVNGETSAVLHRISVAVAGALRGDHVPVVLGGEHTVTFGAVQGFCAAGRRIGVVQFDAHADLRDTYEGTPLSHACVMRRIVELDVPVFQIAVRSLSLPEHRFRAENGIPFLDMADLRREGMPKTLLPDSFPEEIYVTFDLDALDPAVLPGTGTPEPGGLFWHEALELLARLSQGRKIVGFDVVELAPIEGAPPISEFTAAKLVYTLMGLAQGGVA